MKIIIILSLMIITLLADGFKYIQIIKCNTPVEDIVKTINSIQSGTVLKFENGTYDFKNQKIAIEDKNYISIEGNNYQKTIIKNLSLSYNSSNFGQLKRLTYINSFISFNSSINNYIENVFLKSSEIILRSSRCLVSKITSDIGYEHPIIWMDGSTVEVSKVDITNNKSSVIYAKNSNLTVLNSKLSSTNSNTIFSDSSNIHIWGNTFKNNDIFNQKENLAFIGMINSKAIIHKNNFNNFNNFKFGILSSNTSISEIFNNNFEKLAISISINTKSKSRILDNTIKIGSVKGSVGIDIYNAYGLIQHNDFDFIYLPIRIQQKSEVQIAQNKISNLQNTSTSKGLGIIIDKGCIANIWDNTVSNYTSSYIGRADKESHVYLSHNDKGFRLPGLGDPQVVNNPYKFKFVDLFYDFRKDMKKVKIANFIYKDLQTIKYEKKLGERLKGYLKQNIAISFNDYDDVIAKGTFIVVENNIIVEPKEFKGGQCQSVPKLGFDKKHRNLIIVPIFDKQKKLLKFNITSRVSLNKITLDNIPLKYYKTKNLTRARKIRDFEKSYILKIEGKVDKFEEAYRCQFDKNKNITCRKKEKL